MLMMGLYLRYFYVTDLTFTTSASGFKLMRVKLKLQIGLDLVQGFLDYRAIKVGDLAATGAYKVMMMAMIVVAQLEEAVAA